MFGAMFGKLGGPELFVILVIVIIIFGPKNLPKLGKMLGKTAKSFKKGLDETSTDDDNDEE